MDKLKLKSIVIDTISGLQISNHVEAQKVRGKLKQDEWNDTGIDFTNLFFGLRDLGFTLVLIFGFEGRGKTYGIKSLNPSEYLWFNADGKPPTFRYDPKIPEQAEKGKEFSKWYGTITKPGPLMKVPTKTKRMSFDEILKQVAMIKACVKTPNLEVCFDENPIAFLIGHSFMMKGPDNELFETLRVLGKVSTKFGPESTTTITGIAEVNVQNGKPVHELRIQTLGQDSARAPEGMFEGSHIPNSYQLIVDSIDEYYGHKAPSTEEPSEPQSKQK